MSAGVASAGAFAFDPVAPFHLYLLHFSGRLAGGQSGLLVEGAAEIDLCSEGVTFDGQVEEVDDSD